MKKFSFPLSRVMDFRRTQARLEQIKLEGIYAEQRAIDAREQALAEQKAQSEKALRAAESVTGFDLELLDRFKRAAGEEQKRIQQARGECVKRIHAQMGVLMRKRRDLRLLEKLKEQRLAKWEKEMFREIDQQAEEAFLAKWNTR